MTVTLVGLFETQDAARAASRKVEDAGIERQAIRITGSDQFVAADRSKPDARESRGAISRFFSGLFGGETQETDHYSEAVHRGHTVLTIDLPGEERVEEIRSILERNGALDIDQRVEEWKRSGYAPASSTANEADRGGRETLKVVAEELKVGKRTVEKGGVRLHRRVVETPVEEQVTLHEERVEIQRRPVDRPVDESELSTAFEDRDIELRETAEEVVVSKSARVVEEIDVRKTASERNETVRGSVRRTEVDIENVEDGETSQVGERRQQVAERRSSAESDRGQCG